MEEMKDWEAPDTEGHFKGVASCGDRDVTKGKVELVGQGADGTLFLEVRLLRGWTRLCCPRCDHMSWSRYLLHVAGV